MTRFSKLRRAIAGAAAASTIALAGAGPAFADYETGLVAFKKQQYSQAIDIWTRFAVAGDVRSKKVLGDVYSGKILETTGDAPAPLEEIPVNNVEALKWYTLAAYHDFTAYQQPTANEVNARILAEQRLSDIRFRMSTSDVKKAEKLVAETFERGSPYDIFRLGMMYQGGKGVSKNNSKALQMFALSKARGVGEASAAFEFLEPLMTKKEIEGALEKAASWQPPLPVEHTGQTDQQKELARLKKELEEIKLEEALEAVSDIDVELIQRALRSLGFYLGSVDNKMGQQTRAAIRRFQYSLVKSDTKLSDAEKDAVRTGVLTARQTVDLFAKSSANDHPMSQYVYGIMHVRGIGVEQNGEEAVKWLGRAASEDLAIAHYALGVIYRDGTTGLNEVSPDKSEAAIHFSKAYSLGYQPAGDALRKLEWEAPRYVD
ncbi:MAG: peptidoglycan-binding protein [Pseudomonadota bacterium]